jgi:hypothetical protein
MQGRLGTVLAPLLLSAFDVGGQETYEQVRTTTSSHAHSPLVGGRVVAR